MRESPILKILGQLQRSVDESVAAREAAVDACADCGHLWLRHEGWRCTIEGCNCDE